MFRLRNARVLSRSRYGLTLHFRGTRETIRVRRGHLRERSGAIYVTAVWFARALVAQRVSETWGAVWPPYCNRSLLPVVKQWRPRGLNAKEAKGLLKSAKAAGLSESQQHTLTDAAILGLSALREGYRWWDISRARARRRLRNILPRVLSKHLRDIEDRCVVTGEHYCLALTSVGNLERALYPQLGEKHVP